MTEFKSRPFDRLLGFRTLKSLGDLCKSGSYTISYAGPYEARLWNAFERNVAAENVRDVVHGRVSLGRSLLDWRAQPFYMIHDQKTGVTALANFSAVGRQLQIRWEVYERPLLSGWRLDGFGFLLACVAAKLLLLCPTLVRSPHLGTAAAFFASTLVFGLRFPGLAALAVLLFPWPLAASNPNALLSYIPSAHWVEYGSLALGPIRQGMSLIMKSGNSWWIIPFFAVISWAVALALHYTNGFVLGVVGLFAKGEWFALLREHPHPLDAQRTAALLQMFDNVLLKSKADSGINEGDLMRDLLEEARLAKEADHSPQARPMPPLPNVQNSPFFGSGA